MNHALFALFALMTTTPLFAEGFYVGTYTSGSESKGIYHGELDAKTGLISDVQLAAEIANPSCLALTPDGKFLYAALEDKLPRVAAFRVAADGKLVALNELPSGGADPCHVSVDRSGKFLFVANYSGGSIAAFALKSDGSLEDRTAFVEFQGSGPDKNRQTSPHAHGIVASPDNRFVYACDLGTDKVWVFRFDAATGALSPADPAFASVPGGAGARHLVFSKDGKFAYVANEMGLDVTAFRCDSKSGSLMPLQTVPTHATPPAPGASLAEIELHPNGKWLYVSSRGDNTLAVLNVASDGTLKLLENVPAGVKIPRGFSIDPSGSWLVVGGQDDNRLGVLRIDPSTGKLTVTGTPTKAEKPVSILFVK